MKKLLLPIVISLGLGAILLAQTLGTIQNQTIAALTVTTINKLTLTAPATGSTLTLADGKTLTANNTLTLAGTDSTTMTFPTTSATIARTDAANSVVLAQPLGGSTTNGNISGSLTDVTSNPSGTTQNTFYTLNTVSIPASAFNAATRGIQCDTWGVTAGNANNKDFRLNIGSSNNTFITAVTLNAKAYSAHFAIVRTGTSTQSFYGTLQFDSPINTTFSGSIQGTGPAQTETSAIAIQFQSQNTAAAAASATGNGMACTFLN